MCNDCKCCESTTNAILENLKDIVKAEVNRRIDEFNTFVINSEDYKNRLISIVDENNALITLISSLSDLEKARNEYHNNSKEYDALNSCIFEIQWNIERMSKELVDKEYGIIELYKRVQKVFGFTYIDDVLLAKLALTGKGDLDATIESTIDWLFKKLEIYI